MRDFSGQDLAHAKGWKEMKPYAYCLFCETQKCASVAATIEKDFGYRCIFPRIIQRKWVRGACVEEIHSWLPGYVFLYSDEPVHPFYGVNGIIRWLGGGELKGPDYSFAEMLFLQDGVFGTVSLVEEGDRCRLNDPVWEKLSGTVTKVDRGRRRCCIAFDFADVHRTVWVGYDLIERDVLPEENLFDGRIHP